MTWRIPAANELVEGRMELCQREEVDGALDHA